MSGHSLDFCPSSCTHSVQILIWGWRENSTAPMLMTRQQPVEFTSLFVVFQVFAVSSFICKLIYGDKLQKVLICYWFPGCWTTRVTKKISLKNEMTRKLGCRKGTLEYKIRKFIHFVLTWVCSVFDQTCLTFFLTCAQIWILWRGVDYGRRSFDPPPHLSLSGFTATLSSLDVSFGDLYLSLEPSHLAVYPRAEQWIVCGYGMGQDSRYC